MKLVPLCVGVAVLESTKVGGEIFDMNLDSRSVSGELVNGHPPFLPDQDGSLAFGGQDEFDDILARLARVECHHQPKRGVARFHPPSALRSAGKESSVELTAEAEVPFDLADPAGETAGLGERRPNIVDIGFEAVLRAHDALALC